MGFFCTAHTKKRYSLSEGRPLSQPWLTPRGPGPRGARPSAHRLLPRGRGSPPNTLRRLRRTSEGGKKTPKTPPAGPCLPRTERQPPPPPPGRPRGAARPHRNPPPPPDPAGFSGRSVTAARGFAATERRLRTCRTERGGRRPRRRRPGPGPAAPPLPGRPPRPARHRRDPPRLPAGHLLGAETAAVLRLRAPVAGPAGGE